MPSNWLVFDRIRALARQGRVFTHERVFQDQPQLDRLTAGGDFLDFNNQAAILDQTNLQINRLERYKDYEQMDQTGEVSLALDLYADEACCAGNTKIPLLDGTNPTIAELAERGSDAQFWVYAFDCNSGQYVPALAHGARISGENVQTIMVLLDNGTTITCTDNHLFMLRDGSYAEAGSLQAGDRLKPLYKKIQYRGKHHAGYVEAKPYQTASGYEFIFNGSNFMATHRWVHNHIVGDHPETIHHNDFHSRNNLPTNLSGMKAADHYAIHCRLGDKNCGFNKITLPDIESAVAGWCGPMTKTAVCSVCDIGDRALDRVLKTNNLTWSMFRDKYGRCSCCNECRPQICQSRYINKSFGNHTVVSVTKGAIVDKVYDIEVPQYHCFAAGDDNGWVIIHNSLVDPERKHTLIIRARNRRLKRELEELFFGTLQWDNMCRPSVRYLCKYGDLPFEVILDQHRSNVASLKFMNVYNFTRIETRYGDLIGFFYMDALWPRPMFLHPWQVMHLRLTSFENIYHPYGRAILDGGRKAYKQLRLMEDAALIYRICLTGESQIWTPDGHKRIDSINIGNIVYTYCQDGKLVKTKVLNQVCNGVKSIYKVSTKYRSIRATATHPFLIKDLSDFSIKYVDLKDLDPELHLLVSPSVQSGDVPVLKLWEENVYGKLTASGLDRFRSGSYHNISEIMRQVDHPVYLTRQVLYLGKGMPISHMEKLAELLGLGDNDIERYVPHCAGGAVLPPTITKEFTRLFGFLVGDGYVAKQNWRVGIALGSDQEINSKYIKLFSSFHKRVKLEYKKEGTKRRLNTAVVCDKQFYMTFIELGLGGGAHGKRIPSWIYNLPLSYRIEFVLGLIDADGAIRSKGSECYEIELCNKELIEDLKILCDQIGWITGKIRTRLKRRGGMAHMGGEYTSHALYISPKFKVGFEKIEEIVADGEEPVYDITVEHDNHNFIANGVTVHNTRAPEKRKFTIPVGLIPPKEVPEYMQMIARNFKRQRFYNPSTGTFDERYSPLIQEDDFFLPRRPDGTGPDVDVLPGGENMDKIADIEYFKKKMIAPMKIPFARVGIGEGAGEASEKSLSQSHSEFAKAVQWVQREVATGLTKVGIIHLALRGYPIDDLKGFEIALTATSAMEELYRIETWQTRTSVMADLKDLGWFPKEWIVTHFTDLSPDEIEELKEMETEATSGGGGGGGGGGGLDIPGEEPPPDANGMPAPPEAGAEPTPEAAGDEAAALTALEGIDWAADKRLLLELRRGNKADAARTLLEKWAERLGRPVSPENRQFVSGFQNILENKELDGLCRGTPSAPPILTEDLNSELAVDPNTDAGLLVNWSVEKELRDEVIAEVYNVIMAEAPISSNHDDDEITADDLPLLVSSL